MNNSNWGVALDSRPDDHDEKCARCYAGQNKGDLSNARAFRGFADSENRVANSPLQNFLAAFPGENTAPDGGDAEHAYAHEVFGREHQNSS